MSDDVLYFDPTEWTVGDHDDFETVTGINLDEAFMPAVIHDGAGEPMRDEKNRPVKRVRLNAKVLIAIAWIEGRKVDPELTLEEARKTKATAIQLKGAEEDPEADGGANAASESEQPSAPSTSSDPEK